MWSKSLQVKRSRCGVVSVLCCGQHADWKRCHKLLRLRCSNSWERTILSPRQFCHKKQVWQARNFWEIWDQETLSVGEVWQWLFSMSLEQNLQKGTGAISSKHSSSFKAGRVVCWKLRYSVLVLVLKMRRRWSSSSGTSLSSSVWVAAKLTVQLHDSVLIWTLWPELYDCTAPWLCPDLNFITITLWLYSSLTVLIWTLWLYSSLSVLTRPELYDCTAPWVSWPELCNSALTWTLWLYCSITLSWPELYDCAAPWLSWPELYDYCTLNVLTRTLWLYSSFTVLTWTSWLRLHDSVLTWTWWL